MSITIVAHSAAGSPCAACSATVHGGIVVLVSVVVVGPEVVVAVVAGRLKLLVLAVVG